MRTAELTAQVMRIVTEESDIPKEMIYSANKSAEVVDARHLYIAMLHSMGLYVTIIARDLHCKERTVQYAITKFNERISSNIPLKKTYQRVKNRLTKELESSEEEAK